MPERDVVVLPDADALAADVAARTLATLARAQHAGGRAAIALTAGSIMERVWTRLAESPAADTVHWDRVDVFWGDERYVAHDSEERNDRPAERVLFSTAPFSAARRVSMPAADGEYGDDLDAAAAGYAHQLAGQHLDLVLLGIGPDGHCCSLFPRHPGLEDDASILAVRDSPKPPPLRLSFSFGTLNAADEVWAVVSGSGKATAVARALGGADRVQVPSAGAWGRRRTVWLLDREAAAELPRRQK